MGTESLTATTSDAAAQEGTVGVNAVFKAQGRTTGTRRASEACCGYPYYTQLLGDALLHTWADDGQPNVISQEHLAQAVKAFEVERRKHYQKRFLELREIGAVECARNIALALQERRDITPTVLEQCLVQGLQARSALERAGKIVREEGWIDGLWSAKSGMATALLHLGFLWSPEGGAGDSFQAGIPSLTGYVLEAAAPSTQLTA